MELPPISPVSNADKEREQTANLINGEIPTNCLNQQPDATPIVNVVPPTIPVMLPHIPVLYSISGYCASCGATFDQIAVQSMHTYIAGTEYPGETVRDRSVRARAFLDGLDAGLVMQHRGGLSQGNTCAGAHSNGRSMHYCNNTRR